MVIFCIGGVSGTGKTALRLSDPLLRDLPCIDIADIYDENHNIGREAARREMMAQLEHHLEYSDESIVLEAFFAPGKLQRRGVEELAERYQCRVRFIWCHAPRDECRRRVLREDYRNSARRNRARLDFIEDIHGRHFLERPDEEPPCWLRGSCDSCRDWPAEAPPCSECGGPVDCSECIHCADQRGVSYTCSRACRRRRARERRRSRRQSYDSYSSYECY